MATGTIKFNVDYRDRQFEFEHISAGDWMAKWYWAKGDFYELGPLRWLESQNITGTYVDAGANFGNHSVFFANFCPCTRLIAIEAVTDMYDVMVRNVYANMPDPAIRFAPMQWAIYDHHGFMAEWDVLDMGHLGATTLKFHPRAATDTMPVGPLRGKRRVKSETLDRLLNYDEERGREPVHVDFLKMDIEGCEPDAIIGGYRMITHCQPVIMAEANTTKRAAELDNLFAMLGPYRRMRTTFKRNTYVWSTPGRVSEPEA